MWVISRKKLVEAAETHGDLTGPLSAWFKIAEHSTWTSHNDIRQTFSTVDTFGSCTIFNIKGNSYRLIAWINFKSHKVFIRHVLTHAEYDKEGWKNECNA